METPLSPQGQPPKSRLWRRVRRLGLLPVAALVLSGCSVPSFGASRGDTTSSVSVFHLWQQFSIGAVVIGGLTLALIVWASLRYRRRSDAIPKQSQYHIPLELIYTIIPVLIVVGLFAATMVVENKEVANPPTKVTVNVNAFQWGWRFSYPGHSVTVVGQTTQNPTMVIPEGEDVHINLTSTDVVHGFYVHAFNFSRYALPGVLNQFTFDALHTGVFDGQCTQLCGLYHSVMFFRVKVVTPAVFTAWLATNKNVSVAAASASATNLQLSSVVPTKTTKSLAN